MPDQRALRERVRARETLFGTFLNLGSPVSAELCAGAGFDWVILDLEHGSGTEADLLGLLQAVEGTGATAVVRVEEGTRLRIGRALDLGATAVMVPRVDTLEQARMAVGFLRYPPNGIRGIALPTRGAGFGRVGHDELPGVNERLLGVFQVESRSAVEAADELAALDGVDVLFVGPTDLSHALGLPGQVEAPGYLEAVKRVAQAAEANGKAAGILLWSAVDAGRYLDMGYRFLALGSDGMFVAAGARAAIRALREYVGAPS